MHYIKKLSSLFRFARASSVNSVLLLVLSLLFSGCGTSLQVEKIKNGGPASGVVYALPFTQYEIEIKRRVASCVGTNMKVATEVKMTPVSKTDPDHLYAIDLTSLSRFFNHASTNVELFEDTLQLKTINTEVKDKSLEIAAGTVISIATLMTSPPFDSAPLWKIQEPPHCIEGIKEQVEAVGAKNSKVKRLTEELSDQTLLATKRASQIADLAPGKDPDLERSLADAIKAVKAKKALLEEQEKELTKLLKPISHTQKVNWPEKSSETTTTKPFQIPLSVLQKWIRSSDEIIDELPGVCFRIERLDTYGVDPNEIGTDTPVAVANSLQYRTPAIGRLVAFNKASCEGGPDRANTIAHHDGPIAQLGFVNSLPIKTKPFESTKFSAEWTKNGYLLKAGYEKTQSAGESANSFLDSIATKYKDISDLKESEEQKELDAELLRLQALVNIAEAEKKLAPPDEQAEAIKALDADTSLLKAKIERLEAEKKLRELEAGDG